MASWQEIDGIRKDGKAFRALARGLHGSVSALTDWEKDFLESIAGAIEADEYTTRQAEKLLEIRDDYTWDSKTRDGFSVASILRECHEARCDLSQEDEEWIGQRLTEDRVAIRRKHLGRLARCARELHLIENAAS
jgi:hypothetical protein